MRTSLNTKFFESLLALGCAALVCDVLSLYCRNLWLGSAALILLAALGITGIAVLIGRLKGMGPEISKLQIVFVAGALVLYLAAIGVRLDAKLFSRLPVFISAAALALICIAEGLQSYPVFARASKPQFVLLPAQRRKKAA